VTFLAGRGRGAPATTRQIAAAAHVPEGYLSKVLQALAKAGLVSAQRGLNGGFVLCRPAHTLTLLDVVQVVDPSRRITTCPLGIASHGVNLCALHRRLDNAAATVEDALRDATIAQLLAGAGSTPLCDDHRECSRTPELPKAGVA